MLRRLSQRLGRPSRIALIGGPQGLAERAGAALEKGDAGLVVATEHGFHQDWTLPLTRVRGAHPDVLIVGLGAPREMIWAMTHRDQLPAVPVLTCGGSVSYTHLDVYKRQLTDWTADIQAMTGLFYDRGRVYFTKAGSNVLFYRYFTPESKLIGARRLTASTAVAGFTPSAVRSMFLADGLLHAADTGGNLTAIGWTRNPQAGSPTGTATVLGGPAVDGVDWSAKAFFLFQDGAGDNALQPPTAQILSLIHI